MKELQLVVLKPDCIERHLTEEVLSRIIACGLAVVYRTEVLLTEECVFGIYGGYVEKPFYSEMVAYLISAPSIVFIVSGEDAHQVMQQLKGNTYEGRGIRGECARRDESGSFLDGMKLDDKWYVFKNIFHVSDPGKTAEEFFCITGQHLCDIALG